MQNVVIFGGTYEGRILAQRYAGCGNISLTVCVATEYGESLLSESGIRIEQGRKNTEEIVSLLDRVNAELCIDATHPYAAMVTENLFEACKRKGVEYVRITREEQAGGNNAVTVNGPREAAEYLCSKEGNILITTGSKELGEFDIIDKHESRCFVRVLPSVEAINICNAHGYSGKNIIAMQGPFSAAVNEAIMSELNIKYLVTKSSGNPGGFLEKCQAAQRLGVQLIIISRPLENINAQALTLDEMCKRLDNELGIEESLTKPNAVKKVSIIGMGPGGIKTVSNEAMAAIAAADTIIGSERMLSLADKLSIANHNRKYVKLYKCCEVEEYILNNDNDLSFAVLYTGDIGFSSGAKGLMRRLSEQGIECECISGVSSVMYMLNKLGIPWEDAGIYTCHGRNSSIYSVAEAIIRNRYMALLPESIDSLKAICALVKDSAGANLRLVIGNHLSYEDERLLYPDINTLAESDELSGLDSLTIAVFINENPVYPVRGMRIRDGELIRGKYANGRIVPMTKEEIRTLALAKLNLYEDDVLWDIGAGTGSVSIQAAMLLKRGRVLSFERDEAACDLIEENRKHFMLDNIRVINGNAPENLDLKYYDEAFPSRVFIGGSGGRLKSIVSEIRQQAFDRGLNPDDIRFTITAVTLETLAAALEVKEMSENYMKNMEIINVAVSRNGAKAKGMMQSENAVYIISFGGADNA